jgi:hypothetical protein
VYIGIIVRNDGALKAGKKLYISVCGLCIARDIDLGFVCAELGVLLWQPPAVRHGHVSSWPSVASAVVQESDGSGITITNVKKARRKKVKIFPVGLMSGVTAGDPFPEDFEVGILELRFSNSKTHQS